MITPMKWFILSMAAILFWSGSDFFSKVGSPEEDIYNHWKITFFVGTVMGLHALYTLTVGGISLTAKDIIAYLPASACYISSMIIGYAGLRYIELSILSPICNSSGAVACMLCMLFLGQTMPPVGFLGVALITAGILLLEVGEKKDSKRKKQEALEYGLEWNGINALKAMLYPVLYCIIDGLGTFFDAYLLENVIEEEIANSAYEMTFFMMALFALFYMIVIKKYNFFSEGIQKLRRLEGPKLITGVLETAGQYAYVFALADNAVLAAPMVSAYCIMSVVWSRLFLKEKLRKMQNISIVLAIAGIIILGTLDIG